jgi:hypothetical protein
VGLRSHCLALESSYDHSDLVEGGLDVVLEGVVEQVADEAELQPIADAFAAKYGTETWHFVVRHGAFSEPDRGGRAIVSASGRCAASVPQGRYVQPGNLALSRLNASLERLLSRERGSDGGSAGQAGGMAAGYELGARSALKAGSTAGSSARRDRMIKPCGGDFAHISRSSLESRPSETGSTTRRAQGGCRPPPA